MVDCLSYALHFCPQKCRTGQISKLTCSLGTETATNCCFVNRQINVILLSKNIKLLQTSFDLLTDSLTPSATDQLLIVYGSLLPHLFLCYSSCAQSVIKLLYGWCEHLFVVT